MGSGSTVCSEASTGVVMGLGSGTFCDSPLFFLFFIFGLFFIFHVQSVFFIVVFLCLFSFLFSFFFSNNLFLTFCHLGLLPLFSIFYRIPLFQPFWLTGGAMPCFVVACVFSTLCGSLIVVEVIGVVSILGCGVFLLHLFPCVVFSEAFGIFWEASCRVGI